jgi:hypothetical protein
VRARSYNASLAPCDNVKSLRNQIILWLCVLSILGFDRLAGGYVFGRDHIAMEAIVLLIVALWLMCLMVRQAIVPQKSLSYEDKQKLVFLIHERVENCKRKLKDFMRRIFQ